MPKIVVHTDDLPKSAVRQTKLPSTLLGHVREAVHPSPDGKGMLSIEDIWLRQHFEAMLTGNTVARDWLLDKIIKDKKAELDAAPERPTVVIDAVHYYQPLAPALAILGCVTVREPPDGSEAPSRIDLAPAFREALKQHCPADKFAPVLEWLDAGGEQKPRTRDRDRSD